MLEPGNAAKTEFSMARFRSPSLVKELVNQINKLAHKVSSKLGRPVQVMEVCGGHTHAIFQAGLEQLLNGSIEFVHGPGCPVCVLPAEAIDRSVELAQQPNTVLACFGDVLRVPGNAGSLMQARAKGADVRVLYSPFDAIKLAQSEPDKHIVFLAIGFDTTMPSVAISIDAAKKQNIKNLTFLCYHIRLIPTLTSLLDAGEVLLDGFIGPGHVSVVIGSDAYQPIAGSFNKPLVIAGFEPVDFLQALLMLLQQLAQGRCEIENAYTRVVSQEGNTATQSLMQQVFADSTAAWRGLGDIPCSVTSLNPKYQQFDANTEAQKQSRDSSREPKYCGKVLTGAIKPTQCPLFCQGCNPETPLGALMVSSEGACAAYYKYKQGSLLKES